MSVVLNTFLLLFLTFYRASYASTVLAVIVCLSVRPPVCLSQLSRSCTKMAKPRITVTTLYDSLGTRFPMPKISAKF